MIFIWFFVGIGLVVFSITNQNFFSIFDNKPPRNIGLEELKPLLFIIAGLTIFYLLTASSPSSSFSSSSSSSSKMRENGEIPGFSSCANNLGPNLGGMSVNQATCYCCNEVGGTCGSGKVAKSMKVCRK